MLLVLLSSGCAQLSSDDRDPMTGLLPPVDLPQPGSWSISGEVRDFATMARAADPVIDVWTDVDGYAPSAKFDVSGQFHLTIREYPRQDLALNHPIVNALFDDVDHGPGVREVRLRARAGGRCSQVVRAGPESFPAEPLVLWLRDCPSPDRWPR